MRLFDSPLTERRSREEARKQMPIENRKDERERRSAMARSRVSFHFYGNLISDLAIIKNY